MALSENLPVYKVSYDLLLLIYRFSVNMERTYRFTLGERLQDKTSDMLQYISIANSVYDKTKYIQQARMFLMDIRLATRIAHDLRQITSKQYLEVSDKIENISKQLTAWGKVVNNQKINEKEKKNDLFG